MDIEIFSQLATETGIALPPLLRSLIASGKTTYGPDWSSTYQQRMLNDPPALISIDDFEWIDGEQARANIESWLNPSAQSGRVFLPFAQSGAGDAFCLIRHGVAEIGVAMIWHDDDESEMGYASFDDFVCSQFIETFSDLSHAVSDDCTAEEVAIQVRMDVASVTELMDVRTREYLRELSARPLVERSYQRGPRSKPEQVPSFISQAEMDVALAKFPKPNVPPFSVVARWEVRDAWLATCPRYTVTLTDCGATPKQVLVALKQLSAFSSLTSAQLLLQQHKLPLILVEEMFDQTKAERTANIFRVLGASVLITEQLP